VASQQQAIRVGPAQRYKMPSQAAEVAADGAVIEIDAGVYEGDVCVWRQNDLTIRGVGGYAHLKADGRSAEQKTIWVIKGRNCTVESIEFSGAAVPDRNGAGIRIEGPGLTIRCCYFHDNSTIVSYGAEGLSNPNPELYMVNNTLVNDHHTGTFVFIREGAAAKLINNLFVGKGTVVRDPAEQITNLQTDEPGLVDRAAFDYRLTASSPAINAGSNPGSAHDFELKPLYEYLHPVSRQQRPARGAIDIGAYEFGGR